MIKLFLLFFSPLSLLASLLPPSNLHLHALSEHSVSISWDDSPSVVKGYKISRDGVVIAFVKPEISFFIDSGLSPSTSYRYTVQASDTIAYRKLLPPHNNDIYFAAFPDFPLTEVNSSQGIVSAEKITEFEDKAGKSLAIVPFTQMWGNGMLYPKEKIHTIIESGASALVRMEPRSHDREYMQEEHFTLENIIDGDFDQELKAWAEAAYADNIPIMIDFAFEMNGKWFSWNGDWNGKGIKDHYGDVNYPDGPERYRDAYRHIIDIFRAKGVYHVTWFFHPTIYMSEPSVWWNEPKYYYPGDDYIDWIGVSIYGELFPRQAYWDTFDEVLESDDAYVKILEISNNKPFAILELGVTEDSNYDKAAWIEGAFDSILNDKYIHFEMLTYWNENWDNDGSPTILDIDSSPESLAVFRQQIANDRFISSPLFLP